MSPPTEIQSSTDVQDAAQPVQQGQDEASPYPIYYFFYGTLTRPAQLKFILNIPEDRDVSLHKSTIFGYRLAKWGPYPALLPGANEDMVSGYAHLVHCEEDAERLARYETSAYKMDECCILFGDGSTGLNQVLGRVFVYAGDLAHLTLTG